MTHFNLLKKSLLTISFLAISLGISFAQNNLPAGISAQNLIAYYTLDGNANDISGNDKNGTISGNPLMTIDRNGNTDKAYAFNGTSDFINLPGYQPNNENFTVSAWFKFENVEATNTDIQPIFGNWQNTPFLGYRQSEKKFYNLRQYVGGSEYLYWTTTNTIENAVWHHVVMSVNQQTLKATLYFDGISLGDFTLSGNEGFSHGNGALGYIGKDYGSFFSGAIDEVGIWNRALDANEIQNMYNKQSSPITGSSDWKVNGNNIYYNDGNVGIGTNNPQANLSVAGTKMVVGGNAISGNYNADQAVLELQSTSGSFFKMNGGDYNMQFNSSQYGNNLLAEGKDLSFYINDTTSSTPLERMRITMDGRVAIGTTTFPIDPDKEFKLAIDGKVIAEGIKVQNSADWADYVFEKDYELKNLKEVESFINQNKHLPNVPSAKEVNEKGIDLNEMDATLLRKIEELTLYVIELNKEVQELKKENKSLKSVQK